MASGEATSHTQLFTTTYLSIEVCGFPTTVCTQVLSGVAVGLL